MNVTPEEFRAMVRAGWDEAEFQRNLIEMANNLGWRVASFRKVRVQRKNGRVYWETPVAADGRGFPDTLMIKGRRLLISEQKVGHNTTTPEQKLWLNAFEQVGAEVHVWKPEQWREIERTLRA